MVQQKHSLESELRRNWKPEGVDLDPPALNKPDTTRFLTDSTAKEAELVSMTPKGVVFFGLDVVRPQAYTLPKLRREDNRKKENSSSREYLLERKAEATTTAKASRSAVPDRNLPDSSRVETQDA